MDWMVAARYVLIAGVIVGGVLLSVFIFDSIWAHVGFWAAALVVAIALFGVKKWNDRNAVRQREKFERSR